MTTPSSATSHLIKKNRSASNFFGPCVIFSKVGHREERRTVHDGDSVGQKYYETTDRSQIKYHNESDGHMPIFRCGWPLSGSTQQHTATTMTIILYESMWTLFTVSVYCIYYLFILLPIFSIIEVSKKVLR